jgi:uncharacterized membrane protein YgcG
VACGFTLAVTDAQYGADGVVLVRLNDTDGALRPAERARLESQLARFERAFPQLFLVIYLGPLESESVLREFGFWLLNRAAVAGIEFTRSNENGLVLLADPARCLVGVVVGSQVESLLAEYVLKAVLREARDRLRRRGLAPGLRCVIDGLIRELRRRADSDGGDSPTDSSPGPLAGLRRLRLGRRVFPALLIAAVVLAARAGEEELESNFQTGRRSIEPDPLALPQWSVEDRAAFAAGQPVNLGGGLWSDDRFPLEPTEAASSKPVNAEAEDVEFVRPVDLGALVPGPLTIAPAGPEAAELLLRASPRADTPFWRALFGVLPIVIAVFGSAVYWWTRRQERRPRLFHFPDTEPLARLGGPHSGGSGAVLRW